MDFRFWRKIRGNDDLSAENRVILGFAEFLGTGILNFIGCMSCVSIGQTRTHLELSFGFGMAILIAIQAFAHISGGHVNPLVTIAAAIRGVTPLIEVPVYFLGQFFGATAGFGLLRLVTPDKFIRGTPNATGVCSPGISPNITVTQALVAEFMTSFLLVFVACTLWDYRRAMDTDGISLKFGFVIAGLAVAGGPYSGAHMNPARTLGPALINNDWGNIWLYFVAQFPAAFLAGILYTIFFSGADVTKKTEDNDEI